MKVWELEEGVIYASNNADKYTIKNKELYIAMDTTSEIIRAYIKSNEEYNFIASLEFEKYTPPIDWSKVEVDTEVWVRNKESDDWCPRYFARYDEDDKTIYCYTNGKTSFTIDDLNHTHPWKYAKLHTD